MAKTVIVDAGPLAAALWQRDEYHEWARAQFEAATEPFITCEAVISEALHLLRRFSRGRNALYSLIEEGIIEVRYHFAEDAANALKLARQYEAVPMSFADACLVRMAEINPHAVVLTLDSDFWTYRIHERKLIPLLIPPTR